MGWSGGSEIGERLICSLVKHIPDKTIRTKVYKDLIDILTDHDCDTLNECLGLDPTFDKVYNKMFPDED